MLALWFVELPKAVLVSLDRFCVRERRPVYFLGLAVSCAAGLTGCAQQPAVKPIAHSKEYFPSSIYGRASPRVVEDGEPVPRGGGFYLVGKPYSVAGQTYYPSERHYSGIGLASWYGDAFHGRRTANGEVYDRDALSAAHPTMPLPSYARITNLSNNYSMIVRVNDRGPFYANRIVDVSRRTAEALAFHATGTTRVKVEYVGPASLEGSDDSKLLATLRAKEPALIARRDDHPTIVASSEADRVPITTTKAQTGERSRVLADPPPTAPPAPPSARSPANPSTAREVPLPPVRPLAFSSRPASTVATKLARASAH